LVLTGSNGYHGTTIVKAGKLELGANAQSPILNLDGLDVQGGKVQFDYSGASPASSIMSLIRTSFSQSFAAGQIKATTILSPQIGLSVVDNLASQVTIGQAYFGDTNGDGTVNSLDFTAIATNFGASSGKLWFQGDFNYDGMVNGLDFN